MAVKPFYLAVAVVGIGLASGLAYWAQQRPAGGAGAANAAPAASAAATRPAVEAAQVRLAALVDDAQTVGTLRSRQGVMLRPEVSGRVTAIAFRDGERVRKGQLLVQLDDQLPRAQVLQAQAELSIAQANHKRNRELLEQNFISQRSLDESAANLEVARARLSLAQATAARLRIVAPFDGIAGIRSVNVGDYLKDGADIVNIEDIDRVFVDFRLPERFLTKLRQGQVARVDIDALPGQRYTAEVLAINPQLDADGRSVAVRAGIANPQGTLKPGMFARVSAVFGERADARVIPEEAIVPLGARQFVIKLVDGPGQQGKITQRIEVKTGMRQPGSVEIVEGLNPGDWVVTAGHQRIQKDGSAVRVLAAGAPASAPASAPTSAARAS